MQAFLCGVLAQTLEVRVALVASESHAASKLELDAGVRVNGLVHLVPASARWGTGAPAGRQRARNAVSSLPRDSDIGRQTDTVTQGTYSK